jgi:hypothetical protein
MSPLVRRAMVTFHLSHALARLRRHEPLGPVIAALLDALYACFEDTDDPV